MKLQKSLKIALNIIIHSKLRSWLTIIGIVIGVAAIISIVSIGSGFEKDIAKLLSGFGSDTITVTAGFDRANECPGPNCRHVPGGPNPLAEIKPLTKKELRVIKLIPGISAINALVTGNEEVYYLGKTASLTVEGIDAIAWKEITTSTMEKGRFLGPGDANAVVIGNSVAHDVFGKEIGINRQITVNGKAFKVVGILDQSGGLGFDDRKVVMLTEFARDILDKETDFYDAIIVKVKNPDDIENIEKVMVSRLMVLRKVDKDTQDFTVLSMKTLQERISTIFKGLTLFLAVIAAISLIVGAVGIANTMFTSVLEKTKEIGIMKALGAKNSDVMLIFLLNAGLVGFVGGVLGSAIGILIATAIPKIGAAILADGQTLTTSISPLLIIFAIVFSVVLGMLSGVIPAYRASKLKPVDALRAE